MGGRANLFSLVTSTAGVQVTPVLGRSAYSNLFAHNVIQFGFHGQLLLSMKRSGVPRHQMLLLALLCIDLRTSGTEN